MFYINGSYCMNHLLHTTKVNRHRCAIVWKIYRWGLVQYLLYDKHWIFLCLRNKKFSYKSKKVNQLQICQRKKIILGTSSIFLVWLQPSFILGDCQHPSDLNECSQGSCCVNSQKITLLSPWCACFQSPLLQATQHGLQPNMIAVQGTQTSTHLKDFKERG